MKILHIVSSLDKSAGGPSRSVPQTCEHLAALGIEVVLIARPSRNTVTLNCSENFNVRYKSFLQLVRFASNLKKNDFDIIHLQHIWDPYIDVIARAARKKGIPYLVTPRGMLEPWIMNRNRWKKNLAMFLYQKKDIKAVACIQVTGVLEKKHVRQLGFCNPIALIPNGIDLSKIPDFKIEFGSKKIVFLSRIHPKKGIEILLEAWKQISNKDWTLEIAGNCESNYIKKLQSKIETEGIKHVRLLGPLYEADKWDYLKSADLMVLPTYSENFGIVVAESLAIGLPVITTTGTPWQELNTTRSGWCIEPKVQDLTTTLNKAISLSPGELKEMGQNGRKLIEKKYDIKQIARQIADMYEWREGRIEKPDFVYMD